MFCSYFLKKSESAGTLIQNLKGLALIIAENLTFKQTNMAQSTRLATLTKNIYALCGLLRRLLPVAYTCTKLVYPILTNESKGIKNEVKPQACKQWQRNFDVHPL